LFFVSQGLSDEFLFSFTNLNRSFFSGVEKVGGKVEAEEGGGGYHILENAMNLKDQFSYPDYRKQNADIFMFQCCSETVMF